MDREERIAIAIKQFVPNGTNQRLAQMIVQYRCQLTITRERRTKAGDYRHPYGKSGHRISVNGTLNQYAFLITLVHELGHLVCWERHRNKVSPHGKEWKLAFKELMQEFLTPKVFPKDVLDVLKRHMVNPKSATVRDQSLMKALRVYNPPNEAILLETLAIGQHFILGSNSYKKGEKMRTRYRCQRLDSGRTYLVSGIAEVQLL